MNYIKVKPGDVVVTDFSGYQHWSVVSDRQGPNGVPLLISATLRLGTVQEEPWETVTDGRYTYVADISSNLPGSGRVANARSKIGHWSYSLVGSNCENFAKWALGLNPSSFQVFACASGLAVGCGSVVVLSKNPTVLKCVAVAVAFAILFLWLARAPLKKGSLFKARHNNALQSDKRSAASPLHVCA